MTDPQVVLRAKAICSKLEVAGYLQALFPLLLKMERYLDTFVIVLLGSGKD